ncbi:MAG: hypothetical protein IPJ77_05885 [Planctomycetes bacterium]|nr:hypothetical protein [Planctomycetota bacterium]
MRWIWGVVVAWGLAGLGWAQEWQRVEVRTPHYDLVGWGTEEEVRGWSVVLEAAWGELDGVLQARPKLEAGKRLEFRMYPDEAARKEALLAVRQAAPTAAVPVWFSPIDKVVYAYRTPSVVYARMMVIYGAVLQFHGLCKDKNLDLDATWFVHGLAQTLCVHEWDGKRIEFAVQPRLCVIDYPAKALAALGGERFGVDPWNEERMRDPYVNWAAVRFALEGVGKKYRAKYQKLALGHTGSKLSGADFLRSLGREKDVTKEFHDWLVAEQYPLAVCNGDWEDRPDGYVLGGSHDPKLLSAALLRAPRTSLDVRLHGIARPGSSPSVVLAWQDDANYVLGHALPPHFVIDFVRNGGQVDQQKFALPASAVDSVLVSMEQLETKANAIRKRVAERPGSVKLALDGTSLGSIAVYDGPIGLAMLGGIGEFSALAYR